MYWLTQLQKPNYWLLAIAGGLVFLNLTFLEQADNPNLFTITLLFWLAVASLIWDKKEQLQLESGLFSSFFGAILIILILFRSVSPAGYHLLIFPFISGLALCLITSGIKRLYLYRQELVILGLLVFNNAIASILTAINLTKLTAIFSTLALWMTGFNVYRNGLFIILPTGKVEVFGSCSGIDSLTQMLYLSLLFIIMFPIKRWQQIISIIVASFIGFTVNCFRVGLLAILVASSNQQGFEYWHGGGGSLVFSVISVGLFGTFCWLAFLQNSPQNPELE